MPPDPPPDNQDREKKPVPKGKQSASHRQSKHAPPWNPRKAGGSYIMNRPAQKQPTHQSGLVLFSLLKTAFPEGMQLCCLLEYKQTG